MGKCSLLLIAKFILSLFILSMASIDVDENGSTLGSRESGSSGLDRAIASLPNRRMTVEMILFTRIASRIRQSVLGNYDSNYIVDPRAVPLLEE